MRRRIDRERVQQLLAEGAQLVEVLPPEGYGREHLPGAINVPLKRLKAASAGLLDRGRPAIVYCYDDQ